MASAHTILLIQPGEATTRTYVDYNSPCDCMVALVKIYENHLRKLNPEAVSISYSISDLFKFLEELQDVSCLIYQQSISAYAPFNKKWIKKKLLALVESDVDYSSD